MCDRCCLYMCIPCCLVYKVMIEWCRGCCMMCDKDLYNEEITENKIYPIEE